MGPPNPSGSLQLMCRILSLEFFCHSEKTKLLLHGVDPLICFERFQGLLKDWWLGIHEVLERTVLVDLPATLIISTTGVVSYVAQSFFHVALHLFHVALASQKLREKHIRSVRGRWWWWCWCSVLIPLSPTSGCTCSKTRIAVTPATCLHHLHTPMISNR